MSALSSFGSRLQLGPHRPSGRSLHIEPLEPRRLLASYPVDNLNDAGLGSLRHAIDSANQNPGLDSIDLSAVVGMISLTSGELLITDFISIEGPGADVLTIDAGQNSRIFHLQTPTGDNSISGLRLVNGLTTGTEQPGGAICSEAFGVLKLDRMEIFDSGTEGDDSPGGAVYDRWTVTVTNSVIGNNFTKGADSPGGGITSWYDKVQLTASTVSGNTTEGVHSRGGGVYGRLSATLEDAQVSGNRTHGYNSAGGGVFAPTTNIVQSEIRDNHTYGGSSAGGGIYSSMRSTITSSLLQGNSTSGDFSWGGGLYCDRILSLVDSRVLANRTRGDNSAGGGIFGSDSATITGSTIAENVTEGAGSQGGGIRFHGSFSLTDSQVSDNSTYGLKASGAGMRLDNSVTIVDSTISNNIIYGSEGWGGGLLVTGVANISTSTISHNEIRGSLSVGGGIFAEAQTTITRSLVYANSIFGDDGLGGGIYSNKSLTLDNSTVSGNRAVGASDGAGGIFAFGSLTLTQSTVTNNQATRNVGGVWNHQHETILAGSIIAGNTAQSFEKDMFQYQGSISANYSLIWNAAGSHITGASGTGNILNVSPSLGPLADNGGPTRTHALLPGSPALDAGDPSLEFDPDTFDQRGFARVADGDPPESIVIDIGAYEAQSIPSADFDGDGDVDGRDFLAWQRGYGMATGATQSDGNSDDDGDVDASDLTAWRASYGQSESLLFAMTENLLTTASPASAVDAAIALAYGDNRENEKSTPSVERSFVASEHYEVAVLPVLSVPTGDSLGRRTLERSPLRPAVRETANELADQWFEPMSSGIKSLDD